MRINKEIVIGAVICGCALHYWIAYAGAPHGTRIPFVYAFTFRVIPFADWVWTGIGIWYLAKGLLRIKIEARREAELD